MTLEEAGNNCVPLHRAGAFLCEVGSVLTRVVSHYASSRIFFESIVTEVGQVEVPFPSTENDVADQSPSQKKRLLWKAIVSSGDSKEIVYADVVVLATGGRQVIPQLLSPNHDKKILSSDFICTTTGVAALQDRLARARGSGPAGKDRKIVIIGGSHSAFSAVWICLNKLDPQLISFNSGSICIVHRSPVLVFYNSRKDAEIDGYSDFRQLCKHGQVHPFGGIRGDAKQLFRQIKLGKEIRVRMMLLKGGNAAPAAQRLMDEAAVIIWACGYSTNSIPVKDIDGSEIPIHYSCGQIDVDDNARILRQPAVVSPTESQIGGTTSIISQKQGAIPPPISTTAASISSESQNVPPRSPIIVDRHKEAPAGLIKVRPVPVRNLYGTGLGYGLKATFENGELDGSSGRADGVAVFLKRSATLILSSILGTKVFGDNASSWKERIANGIAKAAESNRTRLQTAAGSLSPMSRDGGSVALTSPLRPRTSPIRSPATFPNSPKSLNVYKSSDNKTTPVVPSSPNNRKNAGDTGGNSPTVVKRVGTAYQGSGRHTKPQNIPTKVSQIEKSVQKIKGINASPAPVPPPKTMVPSPIRSSQGSFRIVNKNNNAETSSASVNNSINQVSQSIVLNLNNESNKSWLPVQSDKIEIVFGSGNSNVCVQKSEVVDASITQLTAIKPPALPCENQTHLIDRVHQDNDKDTRRDFLFPSISPRITPNPSPRSLPTQLGSPRVTGIFNQDRKTKTIASAGTRVSSAQGFPSSRIEAGSSATNTKTSAGHNVYSNISPVLKYDKSAYTQINKIVRSNEKNQVSQAETSRYPFKYNSVNLSFDVSNAKQSSLADDNRLGSGCDSKNKSRDDYKMRSSMANDCMGLHNARGSESNISDRSNISSLRVDNGVMVITPTASHNESADCVVASNNNVLPNNASNGGILLSPIRQKTSAIINHDGINKNKVSTFNNVPQFSTSLPGPLSSSIANGSNNANFHRSLMYHRPKVVDL